jgi:hypothetical protein
MVKRESFKIDPNDPDLKIFEEAIANFHPEFYALKQDGKPSYEHPDFCDKTLAFRYLPGSKDPYDIHALNLFDEDAVKFYLYESLVLLGRPFAQLVIYQEQETKLVGLMEQAMFDVSFYDDEGQETTGTQELQKLVNEVLGLWPSLIFKFLVSRKSSNPMWIFPEDIHEIKSVCRGVAETLYLSSKDLFLNEHFKNELSAKKEYAFLVKTFLFLHNEQRDIYVQETVNTLQRVQGFPNVEGSDFRLKPYVDLILSYELSEYAVILDKEHSGIDMEREVELQSPSTFLHMRDHQGKKANDMRATYRWLFIKAWLYSHLKGKDISASKAVFEIAKNDTFYYLDSDKRKVDGDGYEETDDICFRRRHKTLVNELSKWRKHLQVGSGYIEGMLKVKST